MLKLDVDDWIKIFQIIETTNAGSVESVFYEGFLGKEESAIEREFFNNRISAVLFIEYLSKALKWGLRRKGCLNNLNHLKEYGISKLCWNPYFRGLGVHIKVGVWPNRNYIRRVFSDGEIKYENIPNDKYHQKPIYSKNATFVLSRINRYSKKDGLKFGKASWEDICISRFDFDISKLPLLETVDSKEELVKPIELVISPYNKPRS